MDGILLGKNTVENGVANSSMKMEKVPKQKLQKEWWCV